MSTRFGSAVAMLVICMALGAAAVAPAHSTRGAAEDFVGSWITWQTAPDGGAGECRRLAVSAAGADARDGTWDAPGWSGMVNGTVREQQGRAVWAGEWRDGQLAGKFSFALVAGDRFQGTFAGPGTHQAVPWAGVRVTAAGTPDVPCRSAR